MDTRPPSNPNNHPPGRRGPDGHAITVSSLAVSMPQGASLLLLCFISPLPSWLSTPSWSLPSGFRPNLHGLEVPSYAASQPEERWLPCVSPLLPPPTPPLFPFSSRPSKRQETRSLSILRPALFPSFSCIAGGGAEECERLSALGRVISSARTGSSASINARNWPS